MITALTIDEILQLLSQIPEQAAFDWKKDFVSPNDDDKRGELIKDICAIANASPLSYGYIVYGVDPRRPDPLIGVSSNYDDSRLQQLLRGKIEPAPSFLYYEVSAGTKTVAVIQVAPNKKRPFIINADIGRVRRGQIVIRRGSSTGGIAIKDLFEFFYGNTSGYFDDVVSQLGLDVQRQRAQSEYLAELRRGAERDEDAMWRAAGLPGKPRQ
ncbi:MAG: ATP-binding protein [Nitrospirota bacterium]|nr:ATP-binding protein [Nitrospirota bacterium]